MGIRWLGEVELTFNPSFLPFPCPYIHGKKTPSHFHSGWATVKLVRSLALAQRISVGRVHHAGSDYGQRRELDRVDRGIGR